MTRPMSLLKFGSSTGVGTTHGGCGRVSGQRGGGVFSSTPRRARLKLARNSLSAGGVWGGLRV